ncbi:hypothetical protein J2741_000935 [Methanolinea mesophila]|nr:hypothetical protein [Methanolinea mesophila]MBP1928388.1 hypothetical protein [Methanolinea mesophila]
MDSGVRSGAGASRAPRATCYDAGTAPGAGENVLAKSLTFDTLGT